jgi:sortase A
MHRLAPVATVGPVRFALMRLWTPERWAWPTPARIVGAIGRLFILCGVLVLLFVAYQLWGTGLQEARAQDRLDEQFQELLEHAATSTTTVAPDPSASTTLPPESEAADPTNDTAVEIEKGDAVARIEIPRIGVDKFVVQGTAVPDLRKGPGHYIETPMPGEPGNAAIAGHRTTYGAPFGEVDQLEPGDSIFVTTIAGRFEYRVMGADRSQEGGDPASGHFIVKPTDVYVLGDFGDNRLTLTACHPKYSARQRIIVAAELVLAPTDTTTTTVASTTTDGTTPPEQSPTLGAPDLDQGLGGDPDARLPAILWGLAFFVLLAAVAKAGREWKRWPAYGLGLIVLVPVLYVWFENLDRWMPAR